jgi:hypothetical protein
VDDVGFDPLCAQPARQPKAIATGLIGDCDALDRAASFDSFLSPAIQKLQQPIPVGARLFKGCRSIPGTIPPTSQLDWPISTTAINVASYSSATRDLLKLFCYGMGRSIRPGCSDDGAIPSLRAP